MIVEDDMAIAEAIKIHLVQWGFDAECIRDFDHILLGFQNYGPHLVLLDLHLPHFNGYHWCGEIRKRSNVPVIFISSAGDNLDIVLAMQMGADDYLVKPFDLQVLTAKIQAVLRRTYTAHPNIQLLEHGGVFLNLDDLTLSYGECKAELTKNEFQILKILMENPGRCISREILMERLWEHESFIDDNTLTVNIARLRKKMEGIGLEGFIITKKGLGYLVE